jgi:hypothetical protein
MNEIVEAAVTARLRAFVQTAQRAGVRLGIAEAGDAREETDTKTFEQQRAAGWKRA